MNGKLRLTAVLLGLVAPLLTSADTLPADSTLTRTPIPRASGQ